MAIDWQQLYKHRKAAEKAFGAIWDVPIKKRYHTVLAEVGQRDISLLEVGAGDRALATTMQKYWGEFEYKSCDIDPTFDHDFSHSKQIEGEFDLIAIFEMIEHVSLHDAADLLTDCFEHLKSGGSIVLTTPILFILQPICETRHISRRFAMTSWLVCWAYDFKFRGYTACTMMRC